MLHLPTVLLMDIWNVSGALGQYEESSHNQKQPSFLLSIYIRVQFLGLFTLFFFQCLLFLALDHNLTFLSC